MRSSSNNLRAISLEMLSMTTLDMSLEISDLRSKPHRPGANELSKCYTTCYTLYFNTHLLTLANIIGIYLALPCHIFFGKNCQIASSSFIDAIFNSTLLAIYQFHTNIQKYFLECNIRILCELSYNVILWVLPPVRSISVWIMVWRRIGHKH